jgi:hypothetical protein
MPTINGFVLSKEAQEQIESFISNAPADWITNEVGPILSGVRDPNAIRKFLVKGCRGSLEIHPKVISLLRENWATGALVAGFSASFLVNCQDDLEQSLKPGELEVACLVDDRDEVRQIGRSLAGKKRAERTPEDSMAAFHRFAKVLGDTFLSSFDRVATGARIITGSKDLGSEAHCAETLAHVQDMLKECKLTLMIRQCELDQSRQQHTTIVEDNRRKLAELETSLKAELSEVKRKFETTNVQLDKARNALTSEQSRRSKLVAEEVERQLSAVTRPWLEEARRLEQWSATQTNVALIDKVECALQAQEAFDMKSGSRTRLKRRLACFEKLAAKIRDVLEDSVRPLPDIVPLGQEVEREIQTLRRALRLKDQSFLGTEKLVEAINQAKDEAELDELSKHIEAMSTLKLWSHKASVHLQKRLHVAYDRLQTLRERQPAKTPYRTGWDLRQTLGQNRKATVYMDGNNVLNGLDEYCKLLDEDGTITANAEDALVKDVLKIAKQCPAVAFRIVFDSHEASEVEHAANVFVQKSGGSGTDRADSAIVLRLTTSADSESSYVVTEDRGLRDQVVRLKATYVSLPVWTVLAEAFGIAKPTETTEAPVQLSK